MPADAVKFLLVDDSVDNLLALEALLRRDGLEIHKARSGTEALELLLQHDFALALLDVHMTGMDGFELAELMRGTERTRRVPIIFLTGVANDDRRRFRGYESGAIDYLMKPVDPQVLSNKAKIFFELYQHREEVARQRDELRVAADNLTTALHRIESHRDNSPLAILEFDASFRLNSWSKGAERLFGWSAGEAIGRQVTELLMAEGEARDFAAESATMLKGEQSRGMRAWRNRRKDGAAIDCEWYCSALLSPTGELVSVNAEILDITERRRAEETQRLLIAELNHRVKNTLAVVQAIAVQTLRLAANPSDFATAFTGRLQSVAQAHSMLSNTSWRGADLAELARDQLRLGPTEDSRLSISGPKVDLAPQMALHLALILHELGTNARKYGALVSPAGRILLSWTINDRRLQLVWEERGGPAVKAPSSRGFGTTLIEESAKSEGGAATASYRADGIVWEIALRLPSAPDAAGFDRPVAEAARPATTAAARPAQPLSGRRFLVVEDEPMVAMFVTACLEDGGAEETATASTVEQALQMIDEGSYDLVILDGNLHGRPVDSVAAAAARRQVPFLFISGYGREGLPAAFAKADVVAKPFTQAQLVDAVDRMMPPTAAVIRLKR
ncbi:response regulator [Reyranella sp.]|uniref:response regulator n=1 Tax=Reyranella sp. TaxID=1929291 RepID=UPI003BA869AD